MAMKIAAGLALDGEKEFKQAVSGINKDLSVLGSEMKKVTSEFGTNANSMDVLKNKSTVLEKQLVTQKDKVDVLKSALKNAGEQYGENSNQAKEWQIKLNNAEAQLNKTERAIKATEAEAKALNKQKMEKFTNGLKSAAGVAVKVGAAIAAAGAAAAIGIGKMAMSAAASADDINTLSKQTGLSTDEIQKFQYASERIDVPLETLTKSMAKNIKSMAGVQMGTKEVTEAYKALGVEVLNSDGSLRDGQTVYGEVISALGSMENETQRDALAMQVLGKSAQDLNPLILGGADALKKYGEEAEAAGLILSEDQLSSLNELNDAFDKFKATLTGSGSVFATAFAGPLTEGITEITEFIERLAGAFTEGGLDGLADEMAEILNEVIEKVIEFLPTFIDLGVELLGKLAVGIIQNIPTLLKAVPDIVKSLVKAFASVGGELLKIGAEIVNGIWKGISQKAADFTHKVRDFFGGIVKGIKGVLGIQSPSKVFAGIGTNMALGLGEGFESSMTNVAKNINKAIPTPNVGYTIEPTVMPGLFGQNQSENINLTIQIDGQTLARQTYEHFRNEGKMRGVPLVQGV